MTGAVRICQVSVGEIDRREVIRYAGGGVDEGELSAVLDECTAEAMTVTCGRVCFRVLDVKRDGNALDLGFCRVESNALAKNLKGCERIILFAATVGLGIDRLIMKYGRISPFKGLIMQAIGAERIEAVCDSFCEGLQEKGYSLRPRFSPGYGDLPLELQTDIFRALSPEKNIGLTLSSSCLMSPTKSVTAIMGIEKKSR